MKWTITEDDEPQPDGLLARWTDWQQARYLRGLTENTEARLRRLIEINAPAKEITWEKTELLLYRNQLRKMENTLRF